MDRACQKGGLGARSVLKSVKNAWNGPKKGLLPTDSCTNKKFRDACDDHDFSTVI